MIGNPFWITQAVASISKWVAKIEPECRMFALYYSLKALMYLQNYVNAATFIE